MNKRQLIYVCPSCNRKKVNFFHNQEKCISQKRASEAVRQGLTKFINAAQETGGMSILNEAWEMMKEDKNYRKKIIKMIKKDKHYKKMFKTMGEDEVLKKIFSRR